MSNFFEKQYRQTPLPTEPDAGDLRGILPDYEAMVLSVMQVVADRYERSDGYPWIDTKLSLITGEDFPANAPARGRGGIYGWIQGRGLEALAGHIRRFAGRQDVAEISELTQRMRRMMREVLDALRQARARNGGHAFFFMDPQGAPFTLGDDGSAQPVALTEESPYGFSDLFCAKGMYATACVLEDDDALAEAREYFLAVDKALCEGEFVSDQQTLDPKNPVLPVPGRHSHGPRMIQIGGAAVLLEREQSAEMLELGLAHFRFIFENYVNVDSRWPDLTEWDYVEFLDDDGRPYRTDGAILSDSGHALEFVGLGLKFTSVARGLAICEPYLEEIAAIESAMPHILQQNFANGSQSTGGICKTYDLLARKAVNSDMPWWSLPETIRAASACWAISQDNAEQAACLRIASVCHNAFVMHYVRPELQLMAVQTRDVDGNVVDVIPGTSDADPGYHTGLSLIDCLNIIEGALARR